MSNEQTTGPAVLLGKYHDITAFTSDDPDRFVLRGVHYNAERKLLEACDGRVAVRVPVCPRVEEFPPVEAKGNECADTILEAGALKRGLANIPKGNKQQPALGYAKLTTVRSEGAIKATLTTTDLDTEQSVTARTVDAQFPSLDQIWPTKEATLTICLEAAQLARIAAYACKYAAVVRESGGNTHQAVRLSFTNELEPMRFSMTLADELSEAPRLEGLLMPLRIS